MIAVSTEVGVRTTFLQKTSDYAKEFGNSGNDAWSFGNKYTVKVQSILGY